MKTLCTRICCRERNKEKNTEYTVLDEIETPKVLEEQQQQAPQAPENAARRSSRISRPLERYSPSLYYVSMFDFGEPETYEEAMQVETKEK